MNKKEPNKININYVQNYPELSFLAKEIENLRKYNIDNKENGFLFSEGLLVCHILERFLRILLDGKIIFKEDSDLSYLLNRAFAKNNKFLVGPIIFKNIKDEEKKIEIEDFKKYILIFRNLFAGHADYEKLIKNYNNDDKFNFKFKHYEEFFKNSTYIAEVDNLYRILNSLIDQIDLKTKLNKISGK